MGQHGYSWILLSRGQGSLQVVAEEDRLLGLVQRKQQVEHHGRDATGGDGVLEKYGKLLEDFRFEGNAQTQAHRGGRNDGLTPTDAVGHEDAHTGNGDEAEHQHHGPAQHGGRDGGEDPTHHREQPQQHQDDGDVLAHMA